MEINPGARVPFTVEDFEDAMTALQKSGNLKTAYPLTMQEVFPRSTSLGKSTAVNYPSRGGWIKQVEMDAQREWAEQIRNGSFITGTSGDPNKIGSDQFKWPGHNDAPDFKPETLTIQVALLWTKESQFRGVCANINAFAALRLQIADDRKHDYLNISDWNTQNYNISWKEVKQLFAVYAADGLVGLTTEVNRNPAWGEWVDDYHAAGPHPKGRRYILTMQGEMMLVLFGQLDDYDKMMATASINRIENWEKNRKDEKIDELRNDLNELLNL